jgi:hypothetical protein
MGQKFQLIWDESTRRKSEGPFGMLVFGWQELSNEISRSVYEVSSNEKGPAKRWLTA